MTLVVLLANPVSLWLVFKFFNNSLPEMVSGPEYLTQLLANSELTGEYALTQTTRETLKRIGQYTPEGDGRFVLYADGSFECVGGPLILRTGYTLSDRTLISDSVTQGKWICKWSEASMMREFACVTFYPGDESRSFELLLKRRRSGILLCMHHHLDDPDSMVHFTRISDATDQKQRDK